VKEIQDALDLPAEDNEEDLTFSTSGISGRRLSKRSDLSSKVVPSSLPGFYACRDLDIREFDLVFELGCSKIKTPKPIQENSFSVFERESLVPNQNSTMEIFY
jgi:hypothetical protein